MKELPIIVARTAVGKKVKVKIWRNKKEIIKTITLGRLETSEDFKIAEKETLIKENRNVCLKITVKELTKEDKTSRPLNNLVFLTNVLGLLRCVILHGVHADLTKLVAATGRQRNRTPS